MSTRPARSLSNPRSQGGMNESYFGWGKNLYRSELAQYTKSSSSRRIPAAVIAARMREELPADNDRVFAILFGLLQEPGFTQEQLEQAGREIARPKVTEMYRGCRSIEEMVGEIQRGLHLKSQTVAKHIVVDIVNGLVAEERDARDREQARKRASRNQGAYTSQQRSGPAQYGQGGPVQAPSYPRHGSSSYGYSVGQKQGGNQREHDRERAAKKAGKPKNNESATAFTKRKEDDATIMRQKQEKALEKAKAAAAENANTKSTSGIVKLKV